jgi:hypothetical protein
MDESSLERQVQSLVDRDVIRELSHRYALAIDSRDLDGLLDLFTDDYELPDGRRGRDALREWFRAILSSYTTSIHLVGNQVISLDPGDPNRARGEVYCRCELEADPQWIVSCLLYHDEYARVGDGWRFRRRDMLGWYATDALDRPTGPDKARWNPTAQIALPPLPNSPAEATGLPGAWPTWSAFWKQVADDRAGRA